MLPALFIKVILQSLLGSHLDPQKYSVSEFTLVPTVETYYVFVLHWYEFPVGSVLDTHKAWQGFFLRITFSFVWFSRQNFICISAGVPMVQAPSIFSENCLPGVNGLAVKQFRKIFMD